MRSSATARWLTPSLTGWSIRPIAWNSKENLSERNRTLFLYDQLFTRLQNRPSSSGGQHRENGGQHGRILHLGNDFHNLELYMWPTAYLLSKRDFHHGL